MIMILFLTPSALLSVTMSDEDLQKAINSLSCIPADAPVAVSKLKNIYTVKFSGYLGQYIYL